MNATVLTDVDVDHEDELDVRVRRPNDTANVTVRRMKVVI